MAAESNASRDRFLSETETLFIENGYQGTTIRAVCKKAGTSLAILNRNWENKEALFVEMLKRHFEPIHEIQHQRFEVLSAKEEPALYEVIAAFYEPAFSFGSTKPTIYSRAMIDPAPEMKRILATLITDTRERLISLVSKALPSLNKQGLFVAMNIILGAYIYPQAFGHQLAVAMNYNDQNIDWRETAKEIADMLGAMQTGS